MLTTASNIPSSNTGKRSLPALAFAFLALLFSVASPSQANEVDLLKYDLQDLQSDNIDALGEYRGKTTLIMFFEPECPFCFKQTKILNDIQHECSDFQAIGVGVNGNRKDLQEEARHLAPEFPVYQVSSELQSDVGKVEGTPMMIVANKEGVYSSHLRGYQVLDQLLPLLAAAGLECS